MNKRMMLGIGLLATAAMVQGGVVFTEDFQTHADWATLAGGSLPAANQTALVGSNADLRGSTLFNGWNFSNAGAGPFNDDVALSDGSGSHAAFAFNAAEGNAVLGLKNWSFVYKEVSLTSLGGDSEVNLSFDFFASDAAMNEANSLYYGVFDTAPTPGERNDWSVSAIDHALGAVTSQQTGSVALNNVDVSGFTGSLYVGFYKRNWSESIGVDNVVLESVPEPGTLGLITAFGGAILVIRRKFML